MAQVYLPMGYPLLSGEVYSSVLYQGSIVRLYSIPKDPRTEAQVQNRKFLSDVTRMRSMLGDWARGACKYAIGSKWNSVIYQAIKADVQSWWSNAETEWDGFSEIERDGWREFAPYVATYNDPGWIFFGLARVIYNALEFWGEIGWVASPLALDNAEDVAAWWTGDYIGQLTTGTYEESAMNLQFTGSWEILPKVGCSGRYYCLCANAVGQEAMFAYYGKKFYIFFMVGPEFGTYDLYVDSTEDLMNSQYNGTELFLQNDVISYPSKGFHVVRFVRRTARVNIDKVEFL